MVIYLQRAVCKHKDPQRKLWIYYFNLKRSNFLIPCYIVDCTQVTVGIEELNRRFGTPDAGFPTVRCRSRTSCVLAYFIHDGITTHNALYYQNITL